jgi:hypothetical protein
MSIPRIFEKTLLLFKSANIDSIQTWRVEQNGGYAVAVMPEYHRRNVERKSLFNVRVRAWSSR